MKTRITDLLGCQYPVIQGGMAWVMVIRKVSLKITVVLSML